MPVLHTPAMTGLEMQPAKTYLLLHWAMLLAARACAMLASLTLVMTAAAQVRQQHITLAILSALAHLSAQRKILCYHAS
jgi:hypothetical protein